MVRIKSPFSTHYMSIVLRADLLYFFVNIDTFARVQLFRQHLAHALCFSVRTTL